MVLLLRIPASPNQSNPLISHTGNTVTVLLVLEQNTLTSTHIDPPIPTPTPTPPHTHTGCLDSGFPLSNFQLAKILHILQVSDYMSPFERHRSCYTYSLNLAHSPFINIKRSFSYNIFHFS